MKHSAGAGLQAIKGDMKAMQDAMTLEAVELELALGTIDVLTEGFDAALAKAAKQVDGEVLFNMPAIDTSVAQRIGAIAISGQHDQVLFVTLHRDGTTLSVAPPTGDNALLESLGHTYAAVMKRLSD